MSTSIYAECVSVADEIIHCLNRELDALLSSNIETIQECSLLKQNLANQLARLRSGLATTDSGADRTQWDAKWEEVRSKCLRNQRLLKHSLRNLSLLSENLRTLCGQAETYSPAGKKVVQERSGTVVEARY